MGHLGCWILSVCIALLLTSYFSQVTAVSFNVFPTSISIGRQGDENNKLTIQCSVYSAGIQTIELGKMTGSNTKSPVVKVTSGSSNVVIMDTALQQRMTQTGFVNGSSGSLKLVLSDIRCTDAGRYYCSSLISGRSDEATKEVTVQTYPRDITMSINPEKDQFDVGDLLKFNCSGLLGNQFRAQNMAAYWVWQWRFLGDFNTSWARYPHSSNIIYSSPTAANGCQYKGHSILKHTVSSDDNGRQFRCYVLYNPDYGDNKILSIPVTCSTPKDFYCTSHTETSVTLQWVYSGSKASSFMFDLKFRHVLGTRNWKPVNTSAENHQPQTLHTVKVTELTSGSLIYFRLSAGIGQPGQCEAVTTTCFTQGSPGTSGAVGMRKAPVLVLALWISMYAALHGYPVLTDYVFN